MIQLDEFLSSILVDATKGQAIADRVSGEIAQLYKDIEFLKHFPIPKISISSIDLEVNMAIAEYREIPKMTEDMSKQFKVDLSDHIKKIVPTLNESKRFVSKIGMNEREFSKATFVSSMDKKGNEILSKIPLSQILKKETEDNISAYLADNMVKAIDDSIVRPARVIRLAPGAADIEPEKNALKGKLKDVIKEYTEKWWKDYIKKNPDLPKDKVPLIAIEPKELLPIPPEKLTKAKIHLELRPYEWTSMEVEDEKGKKAVRYKLVPE